MIAPRVGGFLLGGAVLGLAAGLAVSCAVPSRYRAVAVVAAEASAEPSPDAATVRQALAEDWRSERLEVRELQEGSVELSFDHEDAGVAYRVLRDLVSRLVAADTAAPAGPVPPGVAPRDVPGPATPPASSFRLETPPRRPRTWPRPALFASLGLAGGLLLGGGLGLLRERTRDRIRSASEVDELTRAPLLAQIPEVRVPRRERKQRRRGRG